MEYWDIFLAIVAVVGLLASVIPFFAKLNRTLGELNATMIQTQQALTEFKNNSRETHGKIYDKLDNHEKRISHLEKGEG